MKMIPEQSLCQLLSLLSLFLAVNLGAPSTRPPDRAEDTNNTTGLANVTTPASKPNWKSATTTSVLRSSNQSVSATSKMSPSSTQSSVIATTASRNYKQNGTLSTTPSGNATIATPASTNLGADTTSSPNDTRALPDTELPLRPTNSSQITEPTTATAPAVNADSRSDAEVKATRPPSTTPATQRVDAAGAVSPRENPKLAPTPGTTTALSTTLGVPFKPRHSTQTMTIVFCSLLGVAALVIFMYTLDRCKQKKTQYLHRPLYNNSEETADRFVPADDTLVISGGLYDGPRVYNPTMTTANDDEEFQCDQASRSTQFQLKLLKDESERPPSYEVSTYQTSQRMDQDA